MSVVNGVTAMFMGGLLVHFGQGPVQIEMHVYFFALIQRAKALGAEGWIVKPFEPDLLVAAAKKLASVA